MCTKDYCICRLHFVGENGQEKEDPDPTSAAASKEKVSSFMYVCKRRCLSLQEVLILVRVVRDYCFMYSILN